MDVKDKRIWITGASSGIGEALARALADKGARLILSARNQEKLEALKASLPYAGNHQVRPLDLANQASIQAAVAQHGDAPLDMLINNGGISQRSLVEDTDLEVHRAVMETNFFGTVALTQALLPRLLDRRAMVVNIASVAGKVGGQEMSGYAASKHALIGFMDCLRAETRGRGLKVLNVCPGFVQTQISINALTADGKRYGRMAGSIARGISPAQCAQAICKAIAKDKDEVVIGKGLSRWAPLIKRISPGLFNRLSAARNIR